MKKKLLNLLKQEGFQGVDANIEISLEEYTVLWSRKHNLAIFNSEGSYVLVDIDSQDALDFIKENDNNGVLSFLGYSTSDKYIYDNKNNVPMLLFDAQLYSSYWTQDGVFPIDGQKSLRKTLLSRFILDN